MISKNITRTAAIIFSEESTSIKSLTVQRKIIESIFVENGNKELSIDKVIVELKTSLGMDFEMNEVIRIINDKKHSNFDVRYEPNSKENYVKLDYKRLQTLELREKQNSVEPHLKRYIQEIYQGKIEQEELERVLYKYLYELLNKNILAFNKISNPKVKVSNLNIDSDIFNLLEREAINGFLEWEDNEKNRSVFALISYAIEYSIITNHYESSSVLLNSIKNKIFYLDNNVLYRAVGINGVNRKSRVLTFIEKCQLSGQAFKISKFTEAEFKDTIKHHVKLLQKLPFKRINPRLFTKYAVNEGIYQYYHAWKANRSTYSFDLFTTHIFSELDNFCKKYNVSFDYNIPFDEAGKEESKKIDEYKTEISVAKGYGYEQSHFYDSINTYLIEKLRGNNRNNITDTKYFFISTDQKLRDWNFLRNDYQPVTLIPSQWMAILLKYFSRTSDDYSSFISFLKLKTNHPLISEDNLQTILAGISEITEDFQKQESILDKMVELKFNGILNGESEIEKIYAKSIEFTTKELDTEIQGLKKGKEDLEFSFSKEQIKFKEILLKEKQDAITDLEQQKIPIDSVADNRFKEYKLKFGLLVCAYYIGLAIITWKIGWDTMEPITYFLGILGIAGSLLYLMIYGKDFNPIVFFEKKHETIVGETYKKFNFNVDRLNLLRLETEEIKTEIFSLKEDLATKIS